jgi:hypothetical protein
MNFAKSPAAPALAFALFVCPAALAPAQEAYEAVLARYQAMKKRPSLNRQVEGRFQLVRTGDPRAFDVIVKDYASPGEPVDFVRSALVTQLAEFHTKEPDRDAWRSWREANTSDEHLWLWYRAVQLEGAVASGQWRELFAQRLPVELRAAILAAAGDVAGGPSLDEDTLGLVMDLAAAMPRPSRERAMLLEGMVELFEAKGKELTGTARGVFHSLLHLMAERETNLRSRIVIARTLARALGRDDIGPDPEGWLELVSDQPAEAIEIGYAKRRAKVPLGFFGIPEHGRSIAYVIDASDSMLQPLTPRELAELQPRTGAGQATPDGKGPGRADAAERAVDWSKVQNRFDAARELLKLALRRLQPDQRFTVILFGSQAEFLAASFGLVAASPANIEKVCTEIDAIRAVRSRNPERPHGELRGSTNMHGGMLLAFRAGDAKKSRSKTERPNPRSKVTKIAPEPAWQPLDERGVDTIYLFSDGDPSGDNWNGVDTNDSDVSVDPESGAKYASTGHGFYPGPFSWPPYLVPDLRRLNLLQRASIHTIGMGEVDFQLLERIAADGRGVCIKIGR